MGQVNNKRKGYYRIFPEDWQIASVGSLLKRIKDPVEMSPSTTYREIGIRSHGKGIFHKKEVLGETLGNKSVFWVKPDCFIVNIVFAWELAVAKTTTNEDGFIASHRFPMYAPLEDKLDLDFLLYYFKTPFGKLLLNLASPGGAGRNKTLGQTEFSKLKLCIPQEIKEQQKIAEILSTWDDAIRLKQQFIEQEKAQKKGLMQLLLTGKIRVTEMGKLSPEDIKKRVTDIQQDIVPEGYQKTKVGIIPKGWTVDKLENYAFIRGRIGWRGLKQSEYTEEGPYLIAGKHINSPKIYWDRCDHISIDRYNESLEIALEKNDIIFSKDGTLGTPAYVDYLPGKATINSTMMLVRCFNDKLNSWFLYHVLTGAQFEQLIREKTSGSSIPHLFQRDMKKLKVQLPTISEQQKIAEILSIADKEIELFEAELELLNTQKKGLMQLLLTGKIRVHEHQ